MSFWGARASVEPCVAVAQGHGRKLYAHLTRSQAWRTPTQESLHSEFHKKALEIPSRFIEEHIDEIPCGERRVALEFSQARVQPASPPGMLKSLHGSACCELQLRGVSRCWRKTHPAKRLHAQSVSLATPSNAQRPQQGRQLETAAAKEPGRTRPWHMHMWSSCKPKTVTGATAATLRRKNKLLIHSVSNGKQHPVTRPNLTPNPFVPNGRKPKSPGTQSHTR